MSGDASTTVRRAEAALARLREAIGGLDAEPSANIQRLTALCGELLEADCALYNRSDGPRLCVTAQWHAPADLAASHAAAGHICHDMARDGRAAPLLIRNLPHTSYAQTDSAVRRYGLRTCLGCAVRRGSAPAGSLCALFLDDFNPDELQSQTIALLATAIGVEETRIEADTRSRGEGELARDVVNALPAAVFLVDAETHRIRDANPAALSLIGARREQVVGQLCQTFIGPAKTGNSHRADAALQAADSRWVLLKVDGTKLEVRATTQALHHGGRRLLLQCVTPLAILDGFQPDAVRERVAGRAETRFLVVSPFAETCAQTVVALRRSGGMATEAADAAEAIAHMTRAVAAGAPFSAVVVDAAMSGIDSLLFANLVREDTRLAATRLVLLDPAGAADFGRHSIAGYAARIGCAADLEALAAQALPVPAPAKEPAVTPQSAAPPVVAARRGTVLLVEDNLISMEVAREMIELLGYRCDRAMNGHDALAAVKTARYDLVLMDCQMPVVDGYEATRRIRQWEGTQSDRRRVPIVALTAQAMKGDRERCLAAGMDDYLTKPIDAKQLSARLAKWVAQGRAEAPASPATRSSS
jgi:CheY-like chemotaxis protein